MNVFSGKRFRHLVKVDSKQKRQVKERVRAELQGDAEEDVEAKRRVRPRYVTQRLDNV